MVYFLDEGDDVAAFSATEAMEQVSRRRDVERRRLLVVERAQPLQAAAAGTLELEGLADDLLDPAALPDQRDVGGPDPPAPGHQPAAPVAAAPPAAVAALRRRRVSSSQSRKTCASRLRSLWRSSVGRGTHRLVLPLRPISRPSST